MSPVKEQVQLPLDLDPEGFEVKYLDEYPSDTIGWEVVPFRFLKYRPRCRLLSDEDDLDQSL